MRFLAISRPTGQQQPGDEPDDMDAEIANGRRLFEAGALVQGYMDPGYITAYFILEADSLQDCHDHLATYPQVRSGRSTYDVVELVGLPAIEQSLIAQGQPLPSWWPSS